MCLRQVVAWCDIETAVACVESALLRMTLPQLNGIFISAPPSHRLLVAAVTPGSGSGPESVVKIRLTRLGIQLRQQVYIPAVGQVDFGVVGTKIIIEVDGYTYHSDPEAFERDRRRDGELVALGYTVVRLSFRRVFSNWAWCERVVLAAIARHAV